MAGFVKFVLSFLCVSLVLYVQEMESAKIVGYPMMGGSHYIGIRRIAEELVSRGHQVTILVSSIQKFQPAPAGLTHAVYKVPFEKDYLEKTMIVTAIKGGFFKVMFGSVNESMIGFQQVFCESLLKDTKLLNPLKDFDMIITDTSMFCGPLIADYLDIMRIEYCPGPPRVIHFPLTLYESALTPSYVPQMMSRNPSKMRFLQRVKNTLILLTGSIIARLVVARPFDQLKAKYNIKPERSFIESMMNHKELTLFLADFALEYSYPIPPGYKMIGPVNIQPVRPLPPDLQEMIDSSGDEGAVIVSFGSNVASILDKDKVDVMAEAFGRLKQIVIWRQQGYIPASLSPNIKPVAWLPQNDLLAHNKLKAFVSHVGQNSFYEAAYRGVPVVGIPLYADQHDNAVLLQEKGLGLVVDYNTATADELYNTIRRVIDEPSFRGNCQRISRLLSDRPRSPVQEAADWIEYTLRHGGLPHLRLYSSQLAWYQYFLVDVALFLVFVLFVVIMSIRYSVRFVCWLCCRRTNKVKTH